MLPFRRDFNAKRINRVCNDPSVFPDISLPGQGAIDVSPIINDLRNIVLMCDEGGIIAHWREPGIYEIHTQFTEKYRGIGAVKTVREMISWLFTQSPAMELQTQIPAVNQAAHSLVKAISGRLEFEREWVWQLPDGQAPCRMDYYTLRYTDWLYSAWAMGPLAARGEWFHAKLDEAKRAFLQVPESHGPDAAHDVNVGATIEMIFGQEIDKGLTLYNRWARFAGFAEVRVISAKPLIIDIQDALVLVDIWQKDFEVLSCRTLPSMQDNAQLPLEFGEAS
jgi:hypothetical protein